MFNIYEYNNIPFWNEQQILAKKQFVEMIQFELKSYLQEKNSA